MEQHAEILIGKPWQRRIAGWHDIVALLLMVSVLILLGLGGRQMAGPIAQTQRSSISLSPAVLPVYALRTTTRMLAALVASLIFTFTYATAAAKSRRAEMVLIPLLDVLQSVPILGYLSFTVVFFVALFRQSAPRVRFQCELEDHLTTHDAEKTLQTIIRWGRYAELFQYDDESHTFRSRQFPGS
jgi:hypothetical protein